MQKPLNGLDGITKIVIIRRNQKGLLPRRKRGKGMKKLLHAEEESCGLSMYKILKARDDNISQQCYVCVLARLADPHRLCTKTLSREMTIIEGRVQVDFLLMLVSLSHSPRLSRSDIQSIMISRGR
jgi:hypothetical protein